MHRLKRAANFVIAARQRMALHPAVAVKPVDKGTRLAQQGPGQLAGQQHTELFMHG